jgi:hypothetical protein
MRLIRIKIAESADRALSEQSENYEHYEVRGTKVGQRALLRQTELASSKPSIKLQRLDNDFNGFGRSKQVLNNDLLVFEDLVVFKKSAKLRNTWPGSWSLCE